MKNPTPKFQRYSLVHNESTHPGQTGSVLDVKIKTDKRGNKTVWYQIGFAGRPAIWHPENELKSA